MKIRQKNIYSYKKKKPVIRIGLIVILSGVLFLIVREGVRRTPQLSDRYTLFVEINEALDRNTANLSEVNRKNYYQKLINRLQATMEKNERNEWNDTICLLLGKAYYLKGRLERNSDLKNQLNEKAIKYIRRGFALQRKDSQPEFHYWLGQAYFYKGQTYYYEAMKELKQIKGTEYWNHDTEKQIAYIYLKKGDLQRARKLYQKLLKEREDPELNFYLGLSWYELGHMEEAEEQFLYAMEAFKNTEEEHNRTWLVYSFFYLGKMYKSKEMYDIAENYLNRALTVYPGDMDVLEELKTLYEKIGNREKAREIRDRIRKTLN